MEKKSVAASILVLFLAITFSVVGACFSYFVFTDTKIEVKCVKIVAGAGINVFADKELKIKADELKLSKMELGLKPATGEVDAETLVPSTINDTGTSEGYYATVYVEKGQNFKVKIKNISIESKQNKTEVKEQRKNVFVSIKDVKDSTKSLEKEEVDLAGFENVTENKELVFMIWLSAFADETLQGAKISFDLEFLPG